MDGGPRGLLPLLLRRQYLRRDAPSPGPQACSGRRPGPQHRRHGRVRPRAGVPPGRAPRVPGHDAEGRRPDAGGGKALPRMPIWRLYAHCYWPFYPRIQLQVRGPGDAGGAAAAEERPLRGDAGLRGGPAGPGRGRVAPGRRRHRRLRRPGVPQRVPEGPAHRRPGRGGGAGRRHGVPRGHRREGRRPGDLRRAGAGGDGPRGALPRGPAPRLRRRKPRPVRGPAPAHRHRAPRPERPRAPRGAGVHPRLRPPAHPRGHTGGRAERGGGAGGLQQGRRLHPRARAPARRARPAHRWQGEEARGVRRGGHRGFPGRWRAAGALHRVHAHPLPAVLPGLGGPVPERAPEPAARVRGGHGPGGSQGRAGRGPAALGVHRALGHRGGGRRGHRGAGGLRGGPRGDPREPEGEGAGPGGRRVHQGHRALPGGQDRPGGQGPQLQGRRRGHRRRQRADRAHQAGLQEHAAPRVRRRPGRLRRPLRPGRRRPPRGGHHPGGGHGRRGHEATHRPGCGPARRRGRGPGGHVRERPHRPGR
mmetsp:Transcript_44423/g.76801  ORF Transcript_44423/g.76801 Transcript_44423/m.76801 type:complete len:532 (-) Transcript_44423:1103-2698(-)